MKEDVLGKCFQNCLSVHRIGFGDRIWEIGKWEMGIWGSGEWGNGAEVSVDLHLLDFTDLIKRVRSREIYIRSGEAEKWK